jgi:hypothetical protein
MDLFDDQLAAAGVFNYVSPDLGRNQRRPTSILSGETQRAGECADAAPGWRNLTHFADRKLLHLLPTRDGHASAHPGL